MPKPRGELIGTRKLTTRSLRAAVNQSQQTVKEAEGWEHPVEGRWLYDQIQGGEKWPAVQLLAREVERHVIVHQQRQVYALVKKLSGQKAADKLARAWTFIRGE